jgi:hypothetical protein
MPEEKGGLLGKSVCLKEDTSLEVFDWINRGTRKFTAGTKGFCVYRWQPEEGKSDQRIHVAVDVHVPKEDKKEGEGRLRTLCAEELWKEFKKEN